MDTGHKTTLVLSTPLFSGVTLLEAKDIASHLIEKTFAPKTIFIKQYDSSSDTYFITAGSARVYRLTENGEEINLAVLGPGEVIGEMTLIDNQTRSAYVEAVQDTTVLVLPKSSFEKILLSYPQVTLNLLRILAKRVRQTNEYVEDLFSKNLYERTWKILVSLAKYFPNRDVAISHEELANIVSATRARITEVLNTLQNDQKIMLSHRKIHVNL